MFKTSLILLIFFTNCCYSQREMRLYSGEIPNSKPAENLQTRTANATVDSLTSNVSVPTLTIYQPSVVKANGTAVIICPGGGYGVLLTNREGSDAARAFNAVGITAFVLKYRLPSARTMIDPTIGPLQDAQQAVFVVRRNAGKWNIKPDRIGIMGYSAGGHVASTLGTHFKELLISDKKANVRPDFLLLINPVISFNSKIGHQGSKEALLGKDADSKQVDYFSNELQVTKDTPPAFLVHTDGDQVVPVENSLEFYKAVKRNEGTAEIHIYEKGEHGFLTSPPFKEWFGRCIFWLGTRGLLAGF